MSYCLQNVCLKTHLCATCPFKFLLFIFLSTNQQFGQESSVALQVILGFLY